jgi:hypothetical protein
MIAASEADVALDWSTAAMNATVLAAAAFTASAQRYTNALGLQPMAKSRAVSRNTRANQ